MMLSFFSTKYSFLLSTLYNDILMRWISLQPSSCFYLSWRLFCLCLIFGSTHIQNNDSKFLSPSYPLSPLNIEPARSTPYFFNLFNIVRSTGESCVFLLVSRVLSIIIRRWSSIGDMPFQILFYPYLFKFPLTFGRSYFISVPVCFYTGAIWCKNAFPPIWFFQTQISWPY